MKKVLLFTAVLVGMSFASCKKDRVCTCTITGNGVSGTPSETTYPKSTKAEARANCLSGTYTDQSGDIYTATCDLK